MDRALSPVAVQFGLDLELGSKWTVIYSKEFGKVFYYEFSLKKYNFRSPSMNRPLSFVAVHFGLDPRILSNKKIV